MPEDPKLLLKDVENEIISAIEATPTPDGMGPQSEVWEKVYEALENLRKKATEKREITADDLLFDFQKPGYVPAPGSFTEFLLRKGWFKRAPLI